VFPVEYGAEVRPGVFEDSARLAQAAIGQNDVSASPLSMAMVAAAVAGDGRMWSPYVLDRVVARDGTVLRRVTPAVWRTAVSPTTAAVLRDGMIATVEGGTATALRTSGLTIGAKTGTAEVGQGAATNAWVIGFAGPAGQPAAVAFAVLVEADAGIGEQTGGAVAAPIARAVVEAALRPMPSVQQSATRS
jgi:peptidoglycan glycosyltransferase